MGVAASSLSLQKARDGAFGALLVKLLRSGPDDEELKKRWSAHSAGVRGDDLLDALEKEWTNAPDQAIKTRSGGNAWVMLPNPIYKPARPERMDAHLLRAARGGEPDEERSYFTGRVAQINRVVAWMAAAQPGTFVVTGSPGSGKSAIIGRIVSLSDREERARLLAQETLEHDDPGEGSVHAHVHALRYTAERLVAAIDEQLVRGGFLVPDANGRRNRGELLGAIQRSPRRPVIAIDGLNESGAESWRMAEDVLRLLSEVALVLVGTQNLPPAEGPLSLIQAVGAKVVVDLDDPALHDETERDLRRYVEKRLANAAGPSMDVAKVASMMLELSGAQNAGAFLLAQVITTQLRGVPVDTSRRTWKKALASSIEQRVERFVGDAPPLNRNELSLPQAARELLEALAWAKGPGMPDDIWPLAATSLSATKTTYERSDVFWLLGRTERYVLEDGQGGRAVYRLVHQWLLEQLRPESAGTSNEPLTADAPAVRLARALVDYYLELLRAGQAPQTHAYLWRYTWQHCADAGELGIQTFRPLVERNTKAFSLDLALGLSALSRQHVRLGHPHDAVKAASETVAIYRELANADPAMVTELAAALVALGSLHSMTGQWEDALTAHTEAVELFKTMAPSNPAVRVPMASALSGLGLSYFLKGQWSKGLTAAEESLALLREPGSDNPAFVADLAVALTVLGLGYAQTGAPEKARATASEAVALFRTMDTSNPAVLPMFMWALTTLAIGCAQTGQPIEARDTAKEAVDLASRMDLDNPAVRPASAMALTILGQSYAQTGQPAESLGAARQAVDLLATMDAANPAIGLMLGSALVILGTGHFQTGQPGESLGPAAQAVDLFRTMDDANPLVLQSLASALTVLGLAYAQTGQPLKARDASAEAVTLIRKTDTDNPVVAQGLAWALSALGLSDVLIGQPQESLEATTEAVELFKKLDTANPAIARIYGLTLANHALASLQTGQLEQAREAGEEAVRLLTLADPRNLLVQPVAWALTVLSQSYLQLGETQKAQAAVRQAVDLFEKTDTANPAIALMFAEALTALSQADLAGKQPEDRATRPARPFRYSNRSTRPIRVSRSPLGARGLSLGLGEAAAGDFAKALDADTKAIDTFQSLVASSPFGLVLLGEALAQFGDHCRQSGRATDADARWKAVVESRPEPRVKVSLLLRLAGWREATDLAAVSDLIQAASFLSDADRDLRAELHQLARSIRSTIPPGSMLRGAPATATCRRGSRWTRRWFQAL